MELKPVIAQTVAVCVAVAIAPWLTGGQEPLALLISAFAILLGSLLIWRQPAAVSLRRGPLVIGFIALIVLAALSLTWTANRYSSALWIIEWVMAGLVFALAFTISASQVGRKWLIGSYLWTAAAFSAVGIVMYLTSSYGRLTGTFYWANPAAAYLIPAVIMGLDKVRGAVGRKVYAWSGLVVLYGAAALLTDSRAALAVLLLVAAVYLLIVKLSKRFWVNLLFIILSVAAVSYGLVRIGDLTPGQSQKVVPGSRLSQAVKGNSSSGSDRIFYLRSALGMWWQHPWVGVGAGVYGDVHPQYQLRVVSASTDAHNLYIQTLAELGTAGFGLLILVLISILLGTVRGLVERPELLPAALGMVGLLMHFGLDIDASYPALLGLVGMFGGLIYAQKRYMWVKPRLWRPAVVLAVLVPVIGLYLSDNFAARGRAAQDDNNYALAADYFDRATQQIVFNPDNISAAGINYLSLAAMGGPDAVNNAQLALDRARHAEQSDPHDAQHWQLEGRVLALEGKLAAAQAAFEHALDLDEFNHPDYASDLANVLLREGHPDRAIKVIDDMLHQYPQSVIDNRVADETLRPSLANLEALKGNIYLAQGDKAQAQSAAQAALKLDPRNLRGRALSNQIAKLAKATASQ